MTIIYRWITDNLNTWTLHQGVYAPVLNAEIFFCAHQYRNTFTQLWWMRPNVYSFVLRRKSVITTQIIHKLFFLHITVGATFHEAHWGKASLPNEVRLCWKSSPNTSCCCNKVRVWSMELKNLPALPLHLELKVVRGILGQRSLSAFKAPTSSPSQKSCTCQKRMKTKFGFIIGHTELDLQASWVHCQCR